MPHRIMKICEIVIATLTISSTVLWQVLLTKIVVGVLVYFISRLIYSLFGNTIESWIKRKLPLGRKRKD